MCDAGSYTSDSGGKASLDGLFHFDRAGRKILFSERITLEIKKIDEIILQA